MFINWWVSVAFINLGSNLFMHRWCLQSFRFLLLTQHPFFWRALSQSWCRSGRLIGRAVRNESNWGGQSFSCCDFSFENVHVNSIKTGTCISTFSSPDSVGTWPWSWYAFYKLFALHLLIVYVVCKLFSIET